MQFVVASFVDLSLLTNIAHSGAYAALLAVPAGYGASTLFLDSLAHGGPPVLGAANVGDTPLLSFWAMGDVSTTGNVLFSLNDQGASGILASSGNRFFHDAINSSGWTLAAGSYWLATVADIGFSGTWQSGTDTPSADWAYSNSAGAWSAVSSPFIGLPAARIMVSAVPEQSSYLLMLAGGVLLAGASLRRARQGGQA